MNRLIENYLLTDFENYDLLKERYLIFFISLFDHFLKEEEYINSNLISYTDVKNDSDKKESFNLIRHKFISLYKSLYELSDRQVMVSLDGNPFIVKSYDDYNDYVVDAIEEKSLCCILYPSLNCFTLTGYDLTHQFFILRDNLKSEVYREQQINTLVNQVELNFLKD